MKRRLTILLDRIVNLYTRYYKFIIVGFFIIFFAVGTLIYKDYGVSWDERAQRNGIGIPATKYIVEGDKSYLKSKDRNYGPIFEIALVSGEKILNLKDPYDIYSFRHFANFTLFFIGTIFFYLLSNIIFKHRLYALLVTLFLILSPRIFAESFYNSKDLPVLSLFIISSYTLLKFLKTDKIHWIILHALACAILIDIRVVGIMLPALTSLLFLFNKFKDGLLKSKSTWVRLGIYLFLFSCFTILFMPLYWHDPIRNFAASVYLMSKFPWDGLVVFMGTAIPASQLPWYYLPVWIVISTPILYTILFLVGTLKIFTNIIKSIRNIKKINEIYLYLLIWFFSPLLLITVLHSTVYDAWRHVYFIYPAFLIISIFGLRAIISFILKYFKRKLFTLIIWTIVFVSMVNTLLFMYLNHPFENVYFNPILRINPQNIEGKFETDYGGLSYKQGLEWILKNDTSDKIHIFENEEPVYENQNRLQASERDRLIFVKEYKDSDYALSTYRTALNRNYPDNLNEVYSISVEGTKILSVFKVKTS